MGRSSGGRGLARRAVVAQVRETGLCDRRRAEGRPRRHAAQRRARPREVGIGNEQLLGEDPGKRQARRGGGRCRSRAGGRDLAEQEARGP